jgi:methylenetetrahydrofolate dehydrogenase (NADP+) / methenyltetrahydrofolate cyclohydrolase / formyltetrahydrofolate synthetase
LDKCRQNIDELKGKFSDFQVGLAIVQVGNREDSNIYIRNKLKTASDCGINATHFKFDNTINESELISEIKKLNSNKNMNGIIVQLPFDSSNAIDSDKIVNTVDPNKDVDGLHHTNAGKLSHSEISDSFVPCTPKGCLELIKSTNVNIRGKNAVVLGRSKLVGSPMANLLKMCDATVTICHSKTERIDEVCKQADILVVAIGKPNYVKGDWIKPGAVVIDCGINSINVDGKAKICGDVDYTSASKVAGYITPVPGGVGPMTVTMLLSNTVEAAKRQFQKYSVDEKWNINLLPLKLKSPVPEDIEIAKAHEPKDISLLAEEIRLMESECELYGRNKAKINLSLLERLKNRENGKYIVVTGINPTPLGEGKNLINENNNKK